MPPSPLFRHAFGRPRTAPVAPVPVVPAVTTGFTEPPMASEVSPPPEVPDTILAPPVSRNTRLFGRLLRPMGELGEVVAAGTSGPAATEAGPVSATEVSPLVPPASVLDAWAELALEMGFRRGDLTECPAQVSQAVWDAVFPPDRPQVLTWAGRLFLAGHKPDEAVRLATERLTIEWCKTGRMGRWMARLGPLLPCRQSGSTPSPVTVAACEAIARTARVSMRAILGSQHQNRTVFLRRAWRAAPGHCLVCGKAADAANSSLWVTWEDFQGGDAIHTGDCETRMRAIGPVFGELVLEEVNRLAELAGPQVSEQVWDPDFGEVGEDAYPHAELSSANAKIA